MDVPRVRWNALAVVFSMTPPLSAFAQAPVDFRLENMVLVPAGAFYMGSVEDDEAVDSDEIPRRTLYLPDFYIDKWEVTNIEYKRFTDDTNYPTPPHWEDGLYAEGTDFFPVVNVSWWEAQAYARWMGKRLPTEAEWEKAACGADERRFPWGDEFDVGKANNSDAYTPSISYFEGTSPCGALNMSGNVAEWTATAYAPYENAASSTSADGGTPSIPYEIEFRHADSKSIDRTRKHFGEKHPYLVYFTLEELSDTRERVYRGGSVNSYAKYLRCANREKSSPDSRWYNIGFRCAMDPPESRRD